jgi:signal transduction histidine kinase
MPEEKLRLANGGCHPVTNKTNRLMDRCLAGWPFNRTSAMTLTGSNEAPSFFRRTHRWHTTTFGWLTVYAVVFTISIMALLAFVEHSVTHAMESQADSAVCWQIRYFDAVSDAELPAAIERRLEREHLRSNYYGLFAPDGRRLAGDIVAKPARLGLAAAGRPCSDLAGHTVLLARNPLLPTVRAMAERRASGVVLITARNLGNVMRIRDQLTEVLIWGGLSCLAASLMISFFLSVRQIGRIEAIQRATTKIAQGNIRQRLPINGADELTLLSHLVNYMLDELERLMNEVKTACDGIAHDLRTPLAHVRTLLAKIALRTRLLGDDGTQRLAEQACGEADSLLERFRALLRIAEIGALQRREGFETLSLSVLINELCELYEPLADEKSIRMTWITQSMDPIHGDRALLFEAFSNLLDNSIKFTPEGGEVRVELGLSWPGPQLLVLDNGPGMPSQAREAVGQRFHRGEQARSAPGEGLGLGIVSAVMRMHDFQLSIGSGDSGTAVRVECWPHSLQQGGQAGEGRRGRVPAQANR